jgi:hypothetical protein
MIGKRIGKAQLALKTVPFLSSLGTSRYSAFPVLTLVTAAIIFPLNFVKAS